MKIISFLITKKTIPFFFFLLHFSIIHTMQPVTPSLPPVLIKPKNGDPFEVPLNRAQLSNVIKNILEDVGNKVEITIALKEDIDKDIALEIFRDILYEYEKNPEAIDAYLLTDYNERPLIDLIRIANTLNYLDIRTLKNPDIQANILPFFIKTIFNRTLSLRSEELIKNRMILNQIAPDIQNTMIDLYIVPYFKNRIIKHYAQHRIIISNQPCTRVAISPDGKTIVAGQEDGNIAVWDTQSYKQTATIKNDSKVMALIFNHEGSLIASGDNQGALFLWDPKTYQEKIHLQKNEAIYSIAFSPDDTKIVFGGNNKIISICDAITLNEIAHIENDTKPIYSALFSPNGDEIIVASEDNLIKWSATTHKKIISLEDHRNSVRSVVWSKNGKKIFLGSSISSAALRHYGVEFAPKETGNLFVRDAHNLKTIASHDFVKDVRSIALSPDNSFLACITSDDLTILNAQTYTIITNLLEKDFSKAVFSPDGTQLICCGQAGLMIWNLVPKRGLEILNVLKASNLHSKIPLIIKLVIIHKLCLALDNDTSVNLTADELAIFNELPNSIKKLLKDGINKSTTSTKKLISQPMNFIERLADFKKRLLNWWQGNQSK